MPSSGVAQDLLIRPLEKAESPTLLLPTPMVLGGKGAPVLLSTSKHGYEGCKTQGIRHPPIPSRYIALEELASADTVPENQPPRAHRWRDGYHMGLVGCMATAASVLLLNCILAIVVNAKHGLQDGYGTIQQGDCSKTKRLDLWLHLLINALSTLLLGASNYTMQCLSAPTREELDIAHAQGKWLDIGVPSVRNLASVAPWRSVLWILLLLSSVPLHLLYNSVIFARTSYAEWQAFAVTPDFLSGAPYTVDASVVNFQPAVDSGVPFYDARQTLDQLRSNKSSTRLDNHECLQAYAPGLQSTWSSVLIVTTQSNASNSFWNLVATNGGLQPGDWSLCALSPPEQRAGCESKHQIDPGNWSLNAPGSPQVAYCMALPTVQHCQVQFSLRLMVVVIVCNCIKVICIGTFAWRVQTRPLVTLGDALASLIAQPDKSTQGNCMGGRGRFASLGPWDHRPVQAQNKRVLWFASASRGRWIITTTLCTCTIIAAIVLLIVGLKQLSDPGSAFALGFGATNVEARLTNQSLNGNIVANILVANSPQLLLSFLYFAYNGLWTCMLLSHEWFKYAQSAKGLRVTSSQGKQRSTYRLQLPYRYSISLMMMSGLLHWLVSQSLFLMLLSAYDYNNNQDKQHLYITCGYSPIAILTSILVGSLTLIVGLLNGFRRYPATSMPMAASCSAALSAACHPPRGDYNAHLKAVKWGVCSRESGGVQEHAEDAESRDAWNAGLEAQSQPEERHFGAEIGHCSFTSKPVDSPIEGRHYAGTEEIRTSLERAFKAEWRD